MSKRFGFVALIGVLVLTVVGVDLYLKEKNLHEIAEISAKILAKELETARRCENQFLDIVNLASRDRANGVTLHFLAEVDLLPGHSVPGLSPLPAPSVPIPLPTLVTEGPNPRYFSVDCGQ